MKRLSFQPLDRSLKILILAGALPLALIVALYEGTVGGAVAALIIALLPLGIAFLSGTTIATDGSRIAVGFRPFYRKRFPVSETTEVDVVSVRAFEDFGGWGIKGKASGKGLLLSSGGEQVVEFTLSDGRRYLVSSQDPEAVKEQLTHLLPR
ncbi:MAG: hypothetical protein ACK5MT_22140 [Actinomycetales bacterium]